jgi:hypothetical protein
MNEAQQAAIIRAREILDEHFENVLLAVSYSVSDDTESQSCGWHGGWVAALGLAHYAAEHLIRSRTAEGEE